ncbi:Cobalamin biosynthesis protein CbiG [Halalkaliarchaeum sp. AArc-CO]|uniref:cobalt-precorrin 5A hydrolase n=1 Tax=Halalkaliarchaeum sp. AArc-CO TaxID=2866381 RepID=UPI00217D1C76|nr:cobalt-precorrin 5A hydrolase [Halalkaliarchaeum sp. AArc-CO]UWG52120.1 Cobalamin biosynthesis protein CbiG [Halalkaliarchaeum sp. AArc-CO]
MSDTNGVESVAVVAFDRNQDIAGEIADELGGSEREADVLEYHADVFTDGWGAFDCFVAVMASGIAIRKVAGLLDDKWSDPAVVVVDAGMTWAIPLVGGHHGGNRIASELAALGATPAVTTATETTGNPDAEPAVETRAGALNARIVTPDSTVATNSAALAGELGPVVRIDGPRAVLVDDEVTVLERGTRAAGNDGVVIGTGCVSGAGAEALLDAWRDALDRTTHGPGDVEFVATGALKEGEEGLYEAAAEFGIGVVTFDRETLFDHEGPTPSKSRELVGWPGIAESSAIAGGREGELLLEKTSYGGEITVAIAR